MPLNKFSFRVSAMLTAIALAGSVAGCRFDTETIAPAGTGTFEANKYVAIGNSITAGFQSSALWETEQRNSFPALIAKQAGATDFQMPLITSPGFGTPKRQEFLGLTPTGSPIIDTAKTSGVPINSALPRAYNNLGVPGALIYDAANTTLGSNCAQALNGGGSNAFFDLVLRNAPGATTGTQIQQAASLSPNFITFWLGNNDVLGYATSGGVKPPAPTSLTTFQTLYGQAISGL
ncbi:MAG: hypothetical protein IAF08_03115, partial [Rhizobacter sp.]|nr:hypothetical protein [Chlorobiales bacterium]